MDPVTQPTQSAQPTQTQAGSTSALPPSPSQTVDTSGPSALGAAAQARAAASKTLQAAQSGREAAAKEQSLVQAGDSVVADPATPEVPPYQPNFKFKFQSKDQEFDEFIRPVIKDAETEKKVRELYEKAVGLDFVKNQREQFKRQHEELRQQHEPITKELKQLGSFIQNKDFDKVASILNIPEEALENWAIERIKYKQLPPEDRARIDAQKQTRDKFYDTRSEADTLREQLESERVSNVTFQMEQLFASEQISQLASQYDERLGKPDSFRDKVLAWGDYLCTREGKFVSPNVVMKDFLETTGLAQELNKAQSQPADAGNAPPQTKPVVTAMPADRPHVKTFQAKSATAVKKQPRSLADLKELQQQMSGSKFEAGRR